MVWSIAGGLLLAAVLILGLAVRPVLVRLGGLRRAAARLQRRRSQAVALQAAAAALNERVALLGEQAEAANRRLASIKARRG